MKNKPLLIKSFMTPFPYSVGADQPLEVAKQIMEEQGIRHVPVLQDHKIVGIISERDVFVTLALMRHLPENQNFTAGEACTTQPITAHLNDHLGEVVAQMAEKHIGSVIVEKDGKAVGIFTTTDVCSVFADFLKDDPDTPTERRAQA